MSIDRLNESLLVQFMRRPVDYTTKFNANEWNLLMRQARATNLLGRVAQLVLKIDKAPSLPVKVRIHLENAMKIGEASTRSALWEIKKIYEALRCCDIPFMLLKGAAYACINASPSAGRMFSDIDIMVHADRLNETEKALIQHGWMPTKLDSYDQKYYRLWMHELPPMQHLKRQTSIDVHHTIIPPTSALKPDTRLLWKSAETVIEFPGAYVLSPEDMIIHSATHLFHEGEFNQGLRDIVDLDALLREQAINAEFWEKLTDRAKVLNLSRPLFYALRYCKIILETPVPAVFICQCQRDGGISNATVKSMDWLLGHAMFPHVESICGLGTDFSRWLLYVRSHYLRMPLHLLIPHLIRKSLSRTK